MLALCYHATTESSSSGRGDVDRAECTGWPRRGGRIALRFNGVARASWHAALVSPRDARASAAVDGLRPVLDMGVACVPNHVFQPAVSRGARLSAAWMGRAAVGVRLYVFGVGRAAEGEEDCAARAMVPHCRAGLHVDRRDYVRHPFLLAFDRGAGERRGGVPGRSSHGRGHGVPSCGMGSHLGRSGTAHHHSARRGGNRGGCPSYRVHHVVA